MNLQRNIHVEKKLISIIKIVYKKKAEKPQVSLFSSRDPLSQHLAYHLQLHTDPLGKFQKKE